MIRETPSGLLGRADKIIKTCEAVVREVGKVHQSIPQRHTTRLPLRDDVLSLYAQLIGIGREDKAELMESSYQTARQAIKAHI